MEPMEQRDAMQASSQTDLLQTSTGSMSPTPSEVSQNGSDISHALVLVELLRQVAPFSSKGPEEIGCLSCLGRCMIWI